MIFSDLNEAQLWEDWEAPQILRMNGQNNTNIYWNHFIIFSVTIFNIYFAFLVLLILTVDCWSVLQITDCVQGKTLINSLNPLQHCLQRWWWSPPGPCIIDWIWFNKSKVSKKAKTSSFEYCTLGLSHCLILVVCKSGSCLQQNNDDASFFHMWPGWDMCAKMVIRNMYILMYIAHCALQRRCWREPRSADAAMERVLCVVLHCVMDS